MFSPLVSVIIPTYNRGHLIEETLESVMEQTYQNWECIVIDDGSTDNTEGIVKNLSEKDERLHFHIRPLNKKKGASSCRNFGLEISRGELVQFLDSDDLLDKTKLMAQVKYWENEGSEILLTCKWGGFESSEDLYSRFKFNYKSYRTFKKNLDLINFFGLYNEFFPLHVYLTPKELIHKAGKWNEELTNNDDAEFFTRVILNSSKIVFVPNTSVFYRYNGGNKLSELDTKNKIISAIVSWELIDKHLKSKNPGYTSTYVRNGAWNIFKVSEAKFPELLNNYEAFFKLRRNFNNRFYLLKKQIRKILKESKKE